MSEVLLYAVVIVAGGAIGGLTTTRLFAWLDWRRKKKEPQCKMETVAYAMTQPDMHYVLSLPNTARERRLVKVLYERGRRR